MNTHDIDITLPHSDEAAAHMLPSDLKKFEFGEHVAEAFSIAVGNPDETSQPLFTLDQVRAAIEADRKRGGEPVELQGVAEAISNGDGFWRSCTGCHETNEGYDTGPYSKTLKCHLGIGCSECGGIGAVWDDTDYDAMADYMARGMGSQQPAEPVKVPSEDQWSTLALWLDRRRGYPTVMITGEVAGDIADLLARHNDTP